MKAFTTADSFSRVDCAVCSEACEGCDRNYMHFSHRLLAEAQVIKLLDEHLSVFSGVILPSCC